MKTAVIVDFDTRRVLFQKIVESLRILPFNEEWDLNWGEPFLAVTRDRRVWVRIFYEESMPVSVEKLKHEIERLKPHLSQGGEICVCLPKNSQLGIADLPMGAEVPVRLWNYSHLSGGEVTSDELIKKKPPIVLTLNKTIQVESAASQTSASDRLSSEEVRELAEMGLALKRFHLKLAS